MNWALSFISIETLALIIGLLFLLRYYIHRKWQYFESKNLPYDPPSFGKFGSIKENLLNPFTSDLERKRRLGNIYGVYAMVTPVIVVHDVDIMRQIYIREFKNFPDRMAVLLKMNGKEMNHGLTVIKNNKWKRIRSTLSPTFSTSKMKTMHSLLAVCASRTVDVLQTKCDQDNGKFIPRIVYSNLSLDVIVTAALGANIKIQKLDGKDTEIVLELRKLFSTSFTGYLASSIFMFPPIERIYEMLGLSIFPLSSIAYLRKFLEAVIDMRKQQTKPPNDLLQLMLDAEVPEKELNDDCLKGLSKEEIIGNAMLMVAAGFENTANSMVFLSYNLAFHPDVQAKLQKEIDEVKAKEGFDYSTVNKMKYLDMCVNESLRLYNPILANSRICQHETTVDGMTIPKGFQFNFPVFALSHDPEHWDEPWEFKPERMEDMSQIDPMVFQPFGVGPRNCIGMRFALMEIKMAMCKILEKFTIKPCDDTPKPPLELVMTLGVKPKEEFSLQVIPR